jgi:hypothetical protein
MTSRHKKHSLSLTFAQNGITPEKAESHPVPRENGVGFSLP